MYEVSEQEVKGTSIAVVAASRFLSSRTNNYACQCDGRRPVCERCEKHGTECVYDVAQEGLTRMQNLQQQLEATTTDRGKMQSLFNMLQHGSDQEATMLLATLRMGATIDELTDAPGGVNVPSRYASASHKSRPTHGQLSTTVAATAQMLARRRCMCAHRLCD